jgi:hypothetical protein
MWITSLLLLAAQAAGLPVAASIEPKAIVPYRPVELTIRGEGFGDRCRVLIGVPGRLVPVRSEIEDDSVIRVHIPAGLSPEPETRKIVVDCGRGRRTGMLTLTVADTAEEDSTEVPSSTSVTGVPIADTAEVSVDDTPAVTPRLVSLDPAEVPAGEPFTLTVMGSNFREGAEVEIFANANAGTSRQPDYRPVQFSAEFASGTVLLVDFDRGFAPSPKLRSVTVVNPDGGHSPPLYLGITRRLP